MSSRSCPECGIKGVPCPGLAVCSVLVIEWMLGRCSITELISQAYFFLWDSCSPGCLGTSYFVASLPHLDLCHNTGITGISPIHATGFKTFDYPQMAALIERAMMWLTRSLCLCAADEYIPSSASTLQKVFDNRPWYSPCILCFPPSLWCWRCKPIPLRLKVRSCPEPPVVALCTK